MKYLSLVLLVLACSTVQAGPTITLSPEPCTGQVICSNVPNSASAEIAYINYSPRYSEVTLVLDGVAYSGGTPGVPSHTPMVAPDGTEIFLTLTFSERTKCAKYCTQQWSLVGGSIVR